VSRRRGATEAALAASEASFEELKSAVPVVFVGSAVAAIGSAQLIGGNGGATLAYLFAVLPLGVLAVGSTAPGLLAALLGGAKARADPSFGPRRARHEAAHFLTGWGSLRGVLAARVCVFAPIRRGEEPSSLPRECVCVHPDSSK